jgi:hypothetical protein
VRTRFLATRRIALAMCTSAKPIRVAEPSQALSEARRRFVVQPAASIQPRDRVVAGAGPADTDRTEVRRLFYGRMTSEGTYTGRYGTSWVSSVKGAAF